jgi:hypothetical protein
MRKYLLIIGLLFSFQSFAWLTGYQNKKIIKIKTTNLTSSLTGFPLYLKCDNTVMGQLVDQTNFYDIRFTDTLDVVIPYECESASSSVGNYWVNTNVSTAGTNIYCYYRNSVSQTDGGNKTGTWDSDFEVVHHLPNGSSLSLTDATGRNNGSGSGITATSGKIDGGANFDGSHYYTITNSASLNNWSYQTISFLVNATSLPNYGRFIEKGANNEWVVACTGGEIFVSLNSGNLDVISNGVVVDNTWHLVDITINNSTKAIQIYVDGSISPNGNSGTGTASATTRTHDIRVGEYGGGGAYYLTGKLDEIRISDIIRTTAWLKFAYYNMFDADQDLTWGSQLTQETISPYMQIIY